MLLSKDLPAGCGSTLGGGAGREGHEGGSKAAQSRVKTTARPSRGFVPIGGNLAVPL